MANNNSWTLLFLHHGHDLHTGLGCNSKLCYFRVSTCGSQLALGCFIVGFRTVPGAYACVCIACSDSSALHTWWTSALGAAQTAPTTTMPSTWATHMDHLAGSATPPSSLRVYLKYAIPIQDLKQGLEPRLYTVSVVPSHLQDVVLLALIVGEHLQVRFA